MVRRFGQFATRHAAFIQLRRFRPLGRLFFEATVRLLRSRMMVLGAGNELAPRCYLPFKRGLNPRFPPTIRMSLKSSQVLLKRLASAVQLRPWPPHFKAVRETTFFPPVRSQSAFAEGDKTGWCTQMILNNLVRTCSSSVRFQSALVRRGLRIALACRLLQSLRS